MHNGLQRDAISWAKGVAGVVGDWEQGGLRVPVVGDAQSFGDVAFVLEVQRGVRGAKSAPAGRQRRLSPAAIGNGHR